MIFLQDVEEEHLLSSSLFSLYIYELNYYISLHILSNDFLFPVFIHLLKKSR